MFSELKFEFVQTATENSSFSTSPTLRVLDAFTGGGAGQSGVREGRQFIVDQSVDFTVRKHALRAGLLFEAGQWDSTQQTNANGTYTFSSLADFEAGLARTFARRVGDPLVSYSQYQLGWYVQDDFRLSKNVQASLGLRQEIQTNLGDAFNLAPRAAVTWTVAKTNVRAGYGIFYDWFESATYEQTVRVDGVRQIDEIILNPTFPVTATSAGTRLPASRIQAAGELTQPTIHQASVGFDKNLKEWLGVRADYMWTRGYNVLRSININAPVDGVRPDPTIGNISEISSTGRSASDRLSVGLNLRVPQRRIFGNVMYQLGSVRNNADSALSLPGDSNNPDADWGPAMQDVRHRLFVMGNFPLPYGLRAGLNMQVSSARPYNITTGLDDNGDTVFNDRPAGVERNAGRGASQMTVDLRLTKSFNLGGLLPGGEGVPMGGPPPPGLARPRPRSPARAWRRRRRRPAHGDHGGVEQPLPRRLLRELPEPLQPDQPERLHRAISCRRSSAPPPRPARPGGSRSGRRFPSSGRHRAGADGAGAEAAGARSTLQLVVPQREPDVLVIGAGVVGCTIAFELASGGRRVRVLDARPPGGGASKASAGVLAPYVEGHDSRPLRELGQRSLAGYESFVERVGGGVRRRGRVSPRRHARSGHRPSRRRAARRLAGHGRGRRRHRRVARGRPGARGRARARRARRRRAAHPDARRRGRAGADPAPPRRRRARSASSSCRRRASLGLSADGAGIAVRTTDGVERAAQVVLAAGAWSAGLAPPGADPVPVRPVRGQLLHLAAAPATLRHIVCGRRMCIWCRGPMARCWSAPRRRTSASTSARPPAAWPD